MGACDGLHLNVNQGEREREEKRTGLYGGLCDVIGGSTARHNVHCVYLQDLRKVMLGLANLDSLQFFNLTAVHLLALAADRRPPCSLMPAWNKLKMDILKLEIFLLMLKIMQWNWGRIRNNVHKKDKKKR